MSRQTTIPCQILIACVLSLTFATVGWADDQRGEALFRLCIAFMILLLVHWSLALVLVRYG